MDTSEVTRIIDQGKDLLAKVKSDPAAYADALAKGQNALLTVQSFLQKLRSGDLKAAEVTLTEWADVNETLLATAAVDAETAKGANGVSVEQVMGVVKTVGELALVGAKIAMVVA